MKDSKVTAVLRTFTKQEYKEFEQFAASPFFRKGRNLTPLIKALKKFHPAFNQRTLTKENVYKKLYKGEYNDRLMRMLMSELLSMGEQFLMQTALVKEKPLMYSLYGMEMTRRNLGFLAVKNIAAASKEIEETLIGPDYFRTLTFIEDAKTIYSLNNDRQAEVCDYIKIKAELSIYNFFSIVSKSLHDLDANKVTFNAEYKEHILMKLLENLNVEKFVNGLGGSRYKNIAEIYLFTILTRLREKDEEYFYKLKVLLFKNMKLFNPEERNYLVAMYQSLCILKKVTVNEEKYVRELFESMKFYLSKKLYTIGTTYFPVLVFMGIFRIALQLKEYDWAVQFSRKYIKLLSPEYDKNTQMYCNAQINFSKGDFGKALDDIFKINMISFPMKFDVSMLQMKIYFEENYIEQALSFVDSNIHFLSKNRKVSGVFKQRRMNFLRYYKKLILFKNGDAELELPGLKEEINGNENLPQKDWLEEKIKELEDKL